MLNTYIAYSLLDMLILFTTFRNDYSFLYKGLLLPSSLCGDMLPIYILFTFTTVAMPLTGMTNDLLRAYVEIGFILFVLFGQLYLITLFSITVRSTAGYRMMQTES